jgi:hypothetical protein
MRGQRSSRTTRRSAAAGRNHTAASGDLGRADQLGGLVAIPGKELDGGVVRVNKFVMKCDESSRPNSKIGGF